MGEEGAAAGDWVVGLLQRKGLGRLCEPFRPDKFYPVQPNTLTQTDFLINNDRFLIINIINNKRAATGPILVYDAGTTHLT